MNMQTKILNELERLVKDAQLELVVNKKFSNTPSIRIMSDMEVLHSVDCEFKDFVVRFYPQDLSKYGVKLPSLYFNYDYDMDGVCNYLGTLVVRGDA